MQPVLVGVGRCTRRESDDTSLKQMIACAVAEAVADAEPAAGTAALLASIDTVAVVGSFLEIACDRAGVANCYPNLAGSVALEAGASNVRSCLHAGVSGNAPQGLVNLLAEQIAAGKKHVCVVTGGEMLRTVWAKLLSGELLELMEQWKDLATGAPPSELVPISDLDGTWSDTEERHGAWEPVALYAMLEQALRTEGKIPIEQHREAIAQLCEEFSRVAASESNRQHSWFNEVRSADQIRQQTDKNDWQALPYTKAMCAMLYVNQSASCILTSRAKALELGIPDHKLVYLHGCGDANDPRTPLQRPLLHRSEGAAVAGASAFRMAHISSRQLQFVDLYTCFPVVPQVVARELDLQHGRPVTLIGGLMSHGGPGANTAMHSIAALVPLLRTNRASFGLIYAQGGLMTKHSIGIYSCKETVGAWCREPPALNQRVMAALPVAPVSHFPIGRAVCDTYTAVYKGGELSVVVVFATLLDGNEAGCRLVANVPLECELAIACCHQEGLVGLCGVVSTNAEGISSFVPDLSQFVDPEMVCMMAKI